MEKNLELSDIGVIKQGQGLVYQGKVTAINGTTGVTVASLSGFGNDFFCPASYADWEMYHAWDAGGAGAAPQGLLARVNDYVSTTGVFTITAFSSGTAAVGDIVMLIHPVLAWLGTKADAAASGAVTTTDFLSAYMKQVLNELLGTDGGWTNMTNTATASLDVALQKLAAVIGIDAGNTFAPDVGGSAQATIEAAIQAIDEHMEAIQGGLETLESLDDELDAMIDMAKTPDTRTISTINVEETISAFTTTNTNPMYIAGIWLGMANLAANEVVRWRVFADWDDASIADQITDDEIWTYGGVQSPAWKYRILGIWVTYEIQVKITQLAGTQREFYSVLDIGQRGS